MDPQITLLEKEIVVVGRALRTSAERAGEDIPTFWRRVMAEQVLSRVPGAGTMYAVYCDYESDARGAYTMIAGVEVPAEAAVPPGMRRVVVPRGQYAQFVAEGDPKEVVWRTWTTINTQWAQSAQRRYEVDYERYAQTRGDGTARVEIGVGIK
jgi:predicted transcriptional regulator YdeE